MFDMKKASDRCQVLSILGIVFALSCIPALLVVGTQLGGEMLPSIWIGIMLYFIFLRGRNTETNEE